MRPDTSVSLGVQIDLYREKEAVVVQVTEGSPSALAGIHVNDVLVVELI